MAQGEIRGSNLSGPSDQTEKYWYLRNRKTWNIFSFKIVDEPLAKSLIEYRAKKDRVEDYVNPNGVSSKTQDGKQMPIIDLDFDHYYEKSTSSGHGHLYLNRPISNFRWFVLMCALRYAGVIELGYFLWSIRRGHNQLRYPGVKKTEEEQGTYTHGWFFKLRPRKDS